MKKLSLTIIVLAISAALIAQKKSITLDNFNQFNSTYNENIKSLPDGITYTVIGENRRTIEKYEYATGKKIGELINLDKLEGCTISTIDGYEINSSETRILLHTNSESIYRRSSIADYYLYNIKYKELKPLTTQGKVRAAIFSPDGESVAFVSNYNVHIAKLRFNTESAITTDGKENSISNGISDWLYEEEFALDRAVEWSADSKEVAYIRFDQSKVKSFEFTMFKGSFPEKSENTLYPNFYSLKYPKAGEENSKVTVNVFNIANRTTKTMDIGKETDIYVPRIKWTTVTGQLGIFKLNRIQNQLDLLIANSATTLSNVVFTHRTETYISDKVFDNFTFLSDASGFVYLGEMDGFNHLHLYSMAGKKTAQLTKGNFDVTQFLGYDPTTKLFYYQSTEASPLQRQIYGTNIDGKGKKQLSASIGTHSANFSTGCKYYVNEFSSIKTAPIFTVCDSKGKQLRIIEDNSKLNKQLSECNIASKEFIKIPLADKTELNGWIIKPIDFNPNEKYPVLITQYSGPDSQRVTDNWEISWEHYLATQGVIVVSIDPRGTGGRGEAFRKCTYLNLGKLESADLIESAKYLGTLSYIDADRIGIYGWSYGGFITLLSMSKSDVFKMGIAVAPVTNWRFYDSAYTERYMKRPTDNKFGYDSNSPTELAKNLSGKLLLIHGSADDNVHLQNTMEYSDKLVQEGKLFNQFIYPNRDHSIYGGNTRAHLYKMMSQYIKENL